MSTRGQQASTNPPQPTEDTEPDTTIIITNTPGPTAIPTEYPTAAPTADIRLNWCSNVTPRAGQECQQPPAPTATAAPKPSCPTVPGEWCVWRSDPETGPEVSTG